MASTSASKSKVARKETQAESQERLALLGIVPRNSLHSNTERLEQIVQLSKNIVSVINDGKSVTSVNKNSVKDLAVEIEMLASIIILSIEHSNALEEVKVSVENTIRTEISKLNSTAPNKDALPTYAQIASSRTTSPPPINKPKTKPSIIIHPSSEDNNRQQVSEQWRKSINFKQVGYAPAGVQPVGKNKLRVEFDTTEQRDETLKRLEAVPDIRAEPSRRLKPMVIVKGIYKQTATDELTQLIIQQNPEVGLLKPSTQDLQFRFVRRNRRENLYNAVMLTSPPIWRKIIELGRLNIDHQKVHVEEFVPLLQCYKCLQFGHLRKYCASNETLCTQCGAEGHTFDTCPSKNNTDEANCSNCNTRNQRLHTTSSTMHSATSNKCPVREAMRNRVMSRIDYGS